MREDSAHAQNHDLSAAAEIFANGTYFPYTLPLYIYLVGLRLVPPISKSKNKYLEWKHPEYMCAYLYIYIYIYLHIHIHIQTNIHIK
jgi:hypothetical protein